MDMDQPEGSHHLVVGEVLVVVFVYRVSTGLCVSPPSVLVAIEAKLQVFGKRHGPRIIGQRHHWSHLIKEADSELGLETDSFPAVLNLVWGGGGGRVNGHQPVCRCGTRNS